ncbi:MAG: HEAT repeat domain-containing protein [Deltaproteobacteria bacterium]|nr:HEAT repeat domain-containing protein [Deltaproteobacteria bacterium]
MTKKSERNDPGKGAYRQMVRTLDGRPVEFHVDVSVEEVPAVRRLRRRARALEAALAALAADVNLSRGTRAQAARGLSHVSHPTEKTLDALVALRDDPQMGVQATYGVGSNVYRLRKDDPALAGRGLNELLNTLTTSQEERIRERALVALGNAGHPDSLPHLERSLGDPSPNVRAAAANAIRRVEGDDGDRLLARALGDTSPAVRRGAVEAMLERAPSQVLEAALGILITTEPEQSVRARAVQVVGTWWLEKPGVLRDSLQSVASYDASEDLRLMARNILAHP